MVHYSTPSTASANFASGLACDSSTRNRPDGGDDPILGYELHRFQENVGRYLREKEDSNRYTATNAQGVGLLSISNRYRQ